MTRKVSIIGLMTLLMAAGYVGVMAQGKGSNQGMRGMHRCTGTGQPQFDFTNKASLEGAVQSVNMGLHQGFPNFTMLLDNGKTVTIVTSPFRTLLDAKYKIALNDRMSVLAYPSLVQAGTYVAAELKNLTNGTVLTLRDDQGVPVGATGCAGCPECGEGAGYDLCPHQF